MKKLRNACYYSDPGNSTFSARLLQPVGRYPVFFLFAALLPILPDVIYSLSREMTFVVWRTLILTLFLSFFRAYVLTVPLCLFARQSLDREEGAAPLRVLRAAYQTVILLFLGAASFAESFLQLRFGTLCSPSIVQVLWETDKQESAEFLKTYCATSSFLVLTLCFVLLAAGYTLLRRRVNSYDFSNKLLRRTLTILLAVGLIVSITRVQVFFKLVALRADTPAIKAPSTPISTFERIHTALSGNNFSPQRAERLLHMLESAQVDSCSFRSPCVVVIVGESFNKHHSSLYGYPLPTSPRLAERQQEGELFVFRDVVSPANLTTSVMNLLFSPASIDKGQAWDEAPLFPALFKKAGYTTYHIDNQTAGTVTNFHDLGLKNMFNARSIPLLFSACNPERHPFDLDLAGDYQRMYTPSDSAELTIFHLIGQHIHYEKRFPAEEAVFTPGDYDRPDLTERQTQTLADYDNATRYNDRVVDSLLTLFTDRDAVVVYLSDHGEEVFDYRDCFGRTYDDFTPEVCRYQLEIPFMIWMSDSYRRRHPDIAAQVARSTARPFSSDDLPHLLLDLAGIHCPWFDPTRSLIHDRFDTSRPRPLLRGYELAGDYDEIIRTQ